MNYNKNAKISTGFYSIDTLLDGGFSKGELLILASRPGVGKTSMMLSFVDKLSKSSNVKVAIFSMDETDRFIKQRLYRIQDFVDAEEYLRSSDIEQLSSDYYDRFFTNVILDDTPHIQICELSDKVSKVVNENNADIVFIESLELIFAEQYCPTEHEVNTIIQRLKDLSLKLAVPIILTCTLWRASKYYDKCPSIETKETKSLINIDIPDKIVFIHRPDYYINRRTAREDAELIIAKNTNGNIGSIPLRFFQNKGKFE